MKTWVGTIAVAIATACIVASVCAQPANPENKAPSDDEIRQLLVQASLAAYGGACPCPESRNAQGELCGGNSAYRRGGGDRPLCYASDVTDAMVQRFRASSPAR